MRSTYASQESGFQRWLRLRRLTQGNDSVEQFYARFNTIMARQKRYMSTPQDEFVYNYMFLEGLRSEVTADLLRLPESQELESLSLQGILELAKRAEQTTRIETGRPASNAPQSGPARRRGHGGGHSSGPYSSGSSGSGGSNRNSEGRGGNADAGGRRQKKGALTPREKGFLQANLEAGGGRYIFKGVQAKSEWHEWARKENACIRCAAKGHMKKDCRVAEQEPNANGGSSSTAGSSLNALFPTSVDDSVMEDIQHYSDVSDLEYICSMTQRKESLMVYNCMVNGSKGTAMTDSGATKNFVSK